MSTLALDPTADLTPTHRAPIRVLFAGGGTGGHLFPGIEVARALTEAVPGAECVFLGTGRPAEVKALAGTPFRGEVLPAAPWRGLRGLPAFLGGTLRALRAAWRRVRDLSPDVVIGLGGYASAAPALVAALSGRPVFLLEQNAIPGRANRLLSRLARAVFVPWSEAAQGFPGRARVEAIGNPVRKAVLEDVRDARATLGLDPATPALLVMGGSQGAQGVNDGVRAAIPTLAAKGAGVQVIHLSGERDHAALVEAYAKAGVRAHVAPYLARMELAYSAADVALARAGGTTIAELACRGLPAVLVPFPAAAEDHQTRNALAAARDGGAIVVEESRLATEGVPQALALLADAERRKTMAEASRRAGRPHAAREIVTRVLEAVHG